MSSRIAVLAGLSSLAVFVNGSAFLKAQVPSAHEVTTAEIETTLSELYSGFASSINIGDIETEMRPMYMALPKNKHGALEQATVRYAVHRYFVQKYGWYMKGLQAKDSQLDSQSSTLIMKDRAPAYVQSLFQERLQDKGFGLRETAIFAGVLSDLVHKESWLGLHQIYTALDLPTSGPVTAAGTGMVVEAYLMHYIREVDMSRTNLATIASLKNDMTYIYPGWTDTAVWADDCRLTYDLAETSHRNPFVKKQETFDDTVKYVQELGHEYGAYQRQECAVLKRQLVDMEFEGTGRVLVSRFYSGGLKGDWTFTEPLSYLRNLGALDETDKNRPSVMIPNYISSSANCLISAGFYKVCCSDECEGLFSQLERSLAVPTASPFQISEVISKLPSDTVDAPRNISSHLIGRLNEIADRHRGSVPLHGRLFAQWMHHAYPRECQFPHLTGTISPMSPMEWLEKTGTVNAATMEDMQFHYDRLHSDEQESLELPWDLDEELVAEHHTGSRSSWSAASVFRFIMILAVIASFAVTTYRAFNTASSGGVDDKIFV